jgi:hypothetical protein
MVWLQGNTLPQKSKGAIYYTSSSATAVTSPPTFTLQPTILVAHLLRLHSTLGGFGHRPCLRLARVHFQQCRLAGGVAVEGLIRCIHPLPLENRLPPPLSFAVDMAAVLSRKTISLGYGRGCWGRGRREHVLMVIKAGRRMDDSGTGARLFARSHRGFTPRHHRSNERNAKYMFKANIF